MYFLTIKLCFVFGCVWFLLCGLQVLPGGDVVILIDPPSVYQHLVAKSANFRAPPPASSSLLILSIMVNVSHIYLQRNFLQRLILVSLCNYFLKVGVVRPCFGLKVAWLLTGVRTLFLSVKREALNLLGGGQALTRFGLSQVLSGGLGLSAGLEGYQAIA